MNVAFHNPHNIKRPQAKKTGATIKKPVMPTVSLTASNPGQASDKPQQHGFDWYRSTADDDAAIMEERRQRNWEEKQRKKEQKKFSRKFGQWNPQAPFRPDRFTNLRAYRASGGYAHKKQAFSAFLAAQSRAHKDSDTASASRPTSPSRSQAPPLATKLSFAPPSSYDDPAALPSDQSGEDAYTRRMRLSQQQLNSPAPPAPPPPSEPSRGIPPPPPSVADDYPLPPPPPPPVSSIPAATSYHSATISAPPVRYANATISAPPVRYEQSDVQMKDSGHDPAYDERPAKRPKISKAEAMMAKMGYKKGQGLGRNSDGVVTHLEVKMRKVPQGGSLLDDEGGGKIKSQQVWDVRGGMRTQKDEPGKFGEESCVVVTWGCVEGVDWGKNADRDDGGIRQEMGEAFSTKVKRPLSLRSAFANHEQFGPVEHVQLDEQNEEGVVYIHFKSVLSALNAVNRFDEGWEFRGRKIRAKYYDERKFHAGIYDY